jgi:hypothetical protein
MRFVCLLLSCVVVMGLAFADVTGQGRPAQARGAISDLAWLVGGWKNEMSSIVTEERWTPAAGGAMLAISRTVKDNKMVAFEYLRIVERDGGLVYIAQPNGQPPTEFVLTGLSAQSATFENPRHDFPKMIRYTLRPDGKLEARVSDGGQQGESFLLTRLP